MSSGKDKTTPEEISNGRKNWCIGGFRRGQRGGVSARKKRKKGVNSTQRPKRGEGTRWRDSEGFSL